MPAIVSTVGLIFLVWVGVIYRMNRRITELEDRVFMLERRNVL